jgi:hypothetical protein
VADQAAIAEVRVVICTYRSRDYVCDAILSCLASGMGEAQISVVDNLSRDGTPELVKERFPQARVLVMERNLGFAAAVNRGAREAGGSFILLLNPDARLGAGSLQVMLDALAADPRRGAISPRVERPDGRLDPACRRTFPDPVTALFRLGGLSRLSPGSARLGAYNLTHIPADRAMVVDSGTGACLLLPRAVWDEVGGLDEGYFMYGEDLELCWQIRERGLVVWYEPGAAVVHLKGRSSEQAAMAMLVQFHKSMWRFYSLHYRQGPWAWLQPLVAAGIGGRLLVLLAINLARRHPRVSP